MLFIGPTLMSGIGQHTLKYVQLFEKADFKHIQDIDDSTPHHDCIFMFALPIGQWIDKIPLIKTKSPKVICMTVCETEPVHEAYGLLCQHFDKIAVPSTFCKEILSKQFKNTEFYVIHAHIPRPLVHTTDHEPYIFYHIGNVMDPRKNFRKILEAFIRLNEPNSRLFVKATCIQNVTLDIPNVQVFNGLLSEDQLERIHEVSDCYVSFSKSEGVGMGAIEAAVRNKPVITTEYGGSKEYIETPYMITCEMEQMENDDFLFKKGDYWGNPNFEELCAYMRDAFDKKLKYMKHNHTLEITGKEHILRQFSEFF